MGSAGAGGLEVLRRRPRFRFLHLGYTVSALGDPLTKVAIMVTAYRWGALAVGAAFALQAVVGIGTSSALGGLGDRLDRRRLLVLLELLRAALLLSAPELTRSLAGFAGLVAATAAINSLAQPARLASLPSLVGECEVRPAAALLTTSQQLGGMLGYPLAGSLLAWLGPGTLYQLDGLTFLVAAAATYLAGELGGSVKRASLGGLGEAWSERRARRPLAIAGLAAFLISCSVPSLLALGYHLSANGPQAYGVLEMCLGAGAIAGGVAMTQAGGGPARQALGLGGMGLFSVALALSPSLALSGTLILLASIGNPVYVVANTTEVLSLAGERAGAVMSARFSLTQAGAVLGSLAGGSVVGVAGPRAAYAAIGFGLLVVSLLALPGRPRLPVQVARMGVFRA